MEYSLGDTDNVSRIFETGVIHQGRGKVFVNFDTDPQTMESELSVKVTLKGQSEQSHEWNTGAVTFKEIPIVAEAPRRLKPDGSTDFDEFVKDTSSMQVGTDTLATSHGFFTKQQIMDFLFLILGKHLKYYLLYFHQPKLLLDNSNLISFTN